MAKSLAFICSSFLVTTLGLIFVWDDIYFFIIKGEDGPELGY
jgi:hypothetical protein